MFCKNCGSQIPDGIAFCAACGTPVPAAPVNASVEPPMAPMGAPVAPVAPIATAPKKSGGAIKLIAIIAAAAILVGVLAGVLFFPTAKGTAKKYALGYYENNDYKAAFSAMAGDAQKFYEEVLMKDKKSRENAFKNMEDNCDDEDLDINVDDFNDYYKAGKELAKVENEDYYGEGYKVEFEVKDEVEMKDKVVEAYRILLDDKKLDDYIDVDKIKKGKFLVVEVDIEGKREDSNYELVIPMVKYGMKWKVLDTSLYLSVEDYEWTEKRVEARQEINDAIAKAEGEEEEDDYSSSYDDIYDDYEDYYDDIYDEYYDYYY